jgi:hypothetical protein
LLFSAAGLLIAPTGFLSGGIMQKGGQGSTGGPTKSPPGKPTQTNPVVRNAVAFGVSPALRSMPSARPNADQISHKQGADADRDINELNVKTRPKIDKAAVAARDAAIVSPKAGEAPATAPPAPAVSFDSLDNTDNSVAFGFRVSPPDTNHDVGPNHVVETTNLLIRVYDKTGAPMTAPIAFSTLVSALGPPFNSTDDGDPIVLYDELADRWLISQFAFPTFPAPPYFQVFAISQTGDPTGAYFLYAFLYDGNNLNDYPHFGVWPDGYYMTANQFLNAASFNAAGAVAYDRKKMLVGDPTATQIFFDLSQGPFAGQGIFGMLPSDLDGLTAPPAGRPNTFIYFTATEFGDSADGLRLFDFHADFANPANSTFTERAESSFAMPLAVAAFNPLSPGIVAGNRRDVRQPAPATDTSRLQAIQDRLMHRLQYRNRGGFESFILNHTVNVGPDNTAAGYRGGIRYYELRQTLPVGGGISIFEQATFAPADTETRWMGSAAVDNQGNLAFGYSVSSLTVFPSIRYAGKLAGEAPALLAETNGITGSGVQTSTGNRWGDYSMMAVDPADDCTFWYSQEYYTAASQATSTVGWLTRILSFKFPSCVAPPRGVVNGVVTDCVTGQPIQNAIVEIQSNGFLRQSDGMGAYSGNLPPGSFDVTARATGYLPGMGTAVITDGNTTTVNICLTPTAIIESAGATIVAEDCAPANGALDPDEMVTVSLCVQNTGAADTMDLVGTLEATGGVTMPSGPQSYGVVTAGGPAVCRDFTFTVSAMCGDTVTATLTLTDGMTSLGSVTYTFQVGVLNTVLMENFDGVTAPALPAGWTATTLQDVANISNPWATTTTNVDTAPNAVFTNDPNNISDEVIDSPSINITSTTAQLTFRNNFDMEDTFDGGVLEISIGGGAFQDIIGAGGSFVSGGYTDTIDTRFGNPLAGRMAWSGTSGGYITTTVNLPASAAGQGVVLRWRRGTDNSVADQFWRIDTISLTDGFVCCIDCIITCPMDVTVSNDPGQCGAVVNYMAPTTVGTCGTVTCTPPSGSFFPVGTTMVTCNTQAGPSCSFNVTVNDTEPPMITCPANVVAVGNPGDSGVQVCFPDPTVTDNCPGVTVMCTPPSGSIVPVGSTTVTCTATDASGNMASCSFTVTVFDIRLQDNSNPSRALLWNSVTGQYIFCCNGAVFTGTGKVIRSGNNFTLDHSAPDRRVRGAVSAGTTPPKGNGSLQFTAGNILCTISDSDTRNNTTICGGAGAATCNVTSPDSGKK